jgi:hypothetical protein
MKGPFDELQMRFFNAPLCLSAYNNIRDVKCIFIKFSIEEIY